MGMINTEFMVIVWGGKDNMKGRGYKGVYLRDCLLLQELAC